MQVTKVDPIFKNQHFASLLKIWQFIRQWGNHILLSDIYQMISLYELQAYIHEDKKLPKYIDNLIQKLLIKMDLSQNSYEMAETLYGICLSNKYINFDSLLKTSAFQLGHSLVNHFLLKAGQTQLHQVQSFHMLDLSQKYKYLRILINYVQAGFIKKIQQELHQKYEKDLKIIEERFANQKEIKQVQSSQNPQEFMNKHLGTIHSKAQQHRTLIKTYFQNSVQFSVLGISEDKCIHLFCQHIPDRILILNSETNQWSFIIGAQNLKQKIVELIQKNEQLSPGQLRLLQSLDIILPDLREDKLNNVFQPYKRLIQQKQTNYNKVNVLKEYLKNIQCKYSQFLGDCFNGRWADKQTRKEFITSIDKSETVDEILNNFKIFYNKTHNCYFKCFSEAQNYDHNLQAPQQNLNFRHFILRNSNYLYAKHVNKSNFNIYNLYQILPKFLAHSQHVLYHAEFLIMSLKSMLGIVNNMYHQCYKRRLIYLQRQKQKKTYEEQKQQQSKNEKQEKQLMKQKYGIYDSSDEELSNSDKTVLKKEQVNSGRNLRLRKAKISYIQDSRSRQNKNNNKNQRNTRNNRNSNQSSTFEQKNKQMKQKKNRMILDSDQQEQYTSYDSQAQTNLQAFRFKHDEPRRQGLRSREKKSEKK